jgi:hypothetical protein
MGAPEEFPRIIEDSNVVQLVESAGEWFVRVIENGRAAQCRSFEKKRLAVACAKAERERLGIQKIDMV